MTFDLSILLKCCFLCQIIKGQYLEDLEYLDSYCEFTLKKAESSESVYRWCISGCLQVQQTGNIERKINFSFPGDLYVKDVERETGEASDFIHVVNLPIFI